MVVGLLVAACSVGDRYRHGPLAILSPVGGQSLHFVGLSVGWKLRVRLVLVPEARHDGSALGLTGCSSSPVLVTGGVAVAGSQETRHEVLEEFAESRHRTADDE